MHLNPTVFYNVLGCVFIMGYTEQQIQQDCDVCGAKESIRTSIRKDIGRVKVYKCRNCGVQGKWKSR